MEIKPNLRHVITHNKILRLWQFWLVLILIIVLCLIYYDRYNAENHLQERIWNLLDPVSGQSTFIITLVLLINQIYQRWEDSLEKMLDVDYVFADGSKDGIIIAQVRGAYLAGETDVRAWSQAMGNQMMGNLDFDMNWDDPRPKVKRDSSGIYVKYYTIRIFLTDHPFREAKDGDSERKLKQLKEAKSNIQDFLKRKFQYSSVQGDLDILPIKWVRSKID